MPDPHLSPFHRLFDRAYPLIRFYYERVWRNSWFTQITPAEGITTGLWLGGAPDTPQDYAFLLEHDIRAVVNIRAEREDDTAFYAQHGIHFVRYAVADVLTPDVETIESAVEWIQAQVDDERDVLVHCAKGRGRSATLLVAYLIRYAGLSMQDAAALLKSKRRLTKLEDRHFRALGEWRKSYPTG